MATLYVASTETFVGKSAVCLGLLDRMRHDGFGVGYMKPVSVSVKHTNSDTLDADTAFIKQMLGLEETLTQLTPVLVTPSVIDSILRGSQPDYARKVGDAYVAVSRNKDVVLLEGTNHWSEGTLVGLSADQVSDMLGAPILLVQRYGTTLAVDTALAVQRFVGDRLLGVLLNQVEEPQYDFVTGKVVPFLESKGVPVLGVIAQDAILSAVTVGDLLEHMGGQNFGRPEWHEKPVESLMVGAMGGSTALSLFRRKANKAVVTGGDRTDVQTAALQTSTSVLILTGNMRPSQAVLDLADEKGVTVVIVAEDTVTTIERAEEIFGRIRFHQPAKLERFKSLLNERFDFERLYDMLGLSKA
jgi:hypothetical protein